MMKPWSSNPEFRGEFVLTQAIIENLRLSFNRIKAGERPQHLPQQSNEV
jgi:hypothetical protein